MITASTLASITALLGVLSTVVSLANFLGLWKLAGATLRNIGADAEKKAALTPDLNDDRIAHVEREALDTIAGLLENPATVQTGLDKFKDLTSKLPVKK